MRIFKGLGYVVYCTVNIEKDSGDFSVVVESAKFHPKYVIHAIHDFLLYMYSEISKRTRSRFYMATVIAVSSHLKEKVHKGKTFEEFWNDVKIKDFTSTYFHELDLEQATHYMNYDVYAGLFYKYIINEQTRRMLTIVAYGKGTAIKLNVNCNISSDKIHHTKLDLDHACI